MDTKRSRPAAFTLIELMVVIAIIGTITAVSMPIYKNYLVKSRTSMMWAVTAEAKLAVESQFLKNPSGISSFTVNGGSAGYTTTSADFVSCIVIKNGVVSVVGNSAKLNALDIWISFVPYTNNNTLEWGCYYSSDASNYLAENCQPVGTCNATNAFGNAVAISSTEYFSYSNNPPLASDYNTQCALSPATFSSCAQCYNFTNTSTVQRYMSYTLISSAPNVFSQQCMQRTAVANNCSTPSAPTC